MAISVACRSRRVVLVALALLVSLPSVAQSVSIAQPRPDQVVLSFYRAYVGELKREKEPIDNPELMQQYVSKGLLKEVHRQIDSGAMDSDYFIRAQDYGEDWANNISVSSPRINGEHASATVTLGVAVSTRQRLSVALTLEDGRWKISRVSAVH